MNITIEKLTEEHVNYSEYPEPKSNSELFSNAWRDLDGQWGVSIGFILVVSLIGYIAGQFLFVFIFGGALAVGQAIFWTNVSKKNNPQIEDIFKGFNSFLNSLLAFWLQFAIIIFGVCLFVIPGIYWALCYSMTYWIIVDNPDIKAFDALSRSQEIMNGHKWKLLRFGLRACFWIALGCVPFCLGLFIVVPWVSVATAKFYEDIKYK